MANLGFAAAAVRVPVSRFLAEAGLAVEPLDVARDARTVAFLRDLELDPVDALGAHAVSSADAWVERGGHEALEASRLARRVSVIRLFHRWRLLPSG